MGTHLAVYSEKNRSFLPVVTKLPLKVEGIRRVLGSPLRYCLGAEFLYLPEHADQAGELKLCWARIGATLLSQIKMTRSVDEIGEYDLQSLERLDDVRIGDRYVRRQKEKDGRFIAVDEFCSQSLIDGIAREPEALSSTSRADFENLCAELFVRRGFKVDLFRPSKDGGIDFLAVQDERTDPIIFAVQCKQPDIREGKSRHSAGRPIVQQIYGAAKAWDLSGGIVVSGSTYSVEAKRFSEIKPTEMQLYSGADVLEWITRYRWNVDE
jgi:HJR/Mrr/RecB family endonuclease